MDTSSNIKFNVEGDDKFSQFLEKTSKSLKELSDKTLKSFTSGFSNSSKEINNSQKAVEKLLVDYKKLTTDTNTLTKATQGLTKSFGLAFTAFNIYTNVTQAQAYFDTVVNGVYEVRDAVTNTNRGLTIMAASGYDATPLVGTFKEVRDVILGSSEAVSIFTTKSTIAFNQFEQKLNEVNIIFGLSQERLSEYGDALQNGLEKNLKNSVSSLTALSAAYQAASAGFTEFQQNLDVVQLAVKANKAAPGSDLFQVGGAIGKGAGVLETKDIKELELTTSKWIATEQLGLTTVGEMTESISDMYMALKNAGVGTDSLVDQTQGLVVAFTKLGAKVPEITTQMEAFSRGVISKTPEAQKALEGLVDAQGKAITLNQEYFKDKGIVKGLTDFAEAVGYNTEKIKEVFNETRSFAFVMKVLAQNGNLAKDSIEQISKVTSENLTQAFDSATSSSQAKMEQITNSYDEIMIEFGKAFKERSQKGIESIELYKELLVTFKEPLIQLAQSSVTLFDSLSKITGVIGAVAKTLLSIGGTLLSFRAFGLILGGLTNGFQELRKESGIIKDLYTSNQGLVAIGKQVLGIDQQRLLSQDRINKAIANSANLENTLVDSIGKTNEERISSISAVQKEIDAIVARDQSIIKSQQNVDKVEQSLKDKQSKRDSQKAEIDSTRTNLSGLKNVKKEIDTKLSDDASNVIRAKKLEELAAKESLILQGNIGEQEKKQLAAINSEKLRLQHTYSQSTLKELENLEKQKSIIRNKANKSDRDLDALAALRSKELAVLEKERNKTKAPLSDKEKLDLTKASQDLTSKIDQEQLVMLTQKQKLQEANNVVDKEAKKLGDAKVKQTENLNRVTKTTAELSILQQDLNTKKINLDRVDIAFKGQQQRLYQIQNSLRKEQNTLDKITNKDSEEYQKQLTKVNQLQKQEAAQISTLQKAKATQQEAQKQYNEVEVDQKKKLKQLTKEQGLAEGSLIEMKTKSGTVTLKNTALNRGLVSTVEGYGKTIEALKNPSKAFADSQAYLKNKVIDLKTAIKDAKAETTQGIDAVATSSSKNFKKIIDGAELLGESLKAAFISTGIGLLISAVLALGVRIFQINAESKKLDIHYKEFNKTLEESANKFDKSTITFEKGAAGLSKFNDKVENSKKLLKDKEPNMFDFIRDSIGKAFNAYVGFYKSIIETVEKIIPPFKILTFVIKGIADSLYFVGDKFQSIFTGWSETDFAKKTANMAQVSKFINNYETALNKQNKELENGNLLTETSNQKIKAKMILTGEDLEREKAANTTRTESFQAMVDVQKKELESLKSKGDDLRDSERKQITVLETEISRREKIIAVSKTQFEEQLKYYEARNLLLDRGNKFSNDRASLLEVRKLQVEVEVSQYVLNRNITQGLDIYSNSIKDSGSKSKQFLTDLKDGSLSVKASLKSLGAEIYKVAEDGKVITKLPDDVLKSIEDALKGKEIDGKKYSLEQVLNLKETRDALKEAGIKIPWDVAKLANKIQESYKKSEGELKLIDTKKLEKDLADFSVLSDKYQETKRKFLSTTKDDVGVTAFSTSIKKSLRLAETDLQTFINALDASSKGANKFVTASVQKFTKEALEGTLDLTEGLKELGKVESDLDFNQLLKLKLAVTGRNKDEILSTLKEIGVETEKVLTADSIDLNKFESNIATFIEGLNAVAESGEKTTTEIAKKFESFYDQMKGKVTPAAYKSLTETLIGYEKAASEQRISYITLETNALEQQKKYGLVLESDYISEVNQLNIKVSEENIESKKLEIKRLLNLYRESAPLVVKAKGELESLESNLKGKKSNNPIEIAQAESREKFEILKKDLELSNITKKQYLEEELKDTENLYNLQLLEKQKVLAGLFLAEELNVKAIKALKHSMELDEKEFNLRVIELNKARIEAQFKQNIEAEQIESRRKLGLLTKDLELGDITKTDYIEKESESVKKSYDNQLLEKQKLLSELWWDEQKNAKALKELRDSMEQDEKEYNLRILEINRKRIEEQFKLQIDAQNKKELAVRQSAIDGSTKEEIETARKVEVEKLNLGIKSLEARLAIEKKGSDKFLEIEKQLIEAKIVLSETLAKQFKDRVSDEIESKREEINTLLALEARNNLTGITEESLEKISQLKEKEIQLNIESVKAQINLTEKGSKERLALEQSLILEIDKLQKAQIERQRERLETVLTESRKKLEVSQLELEQSTITGTTQQDVEKSRKFKEEEIENTVEELKEKIKLYRENSNERIELERNIAKETLKLNKQVKENLIAGLQDTIDTRKKLFKENIQQLEILTFLGTSTEDFLKIQKSKTEEIENNIQYLKEEIEVAKEGSTQRLNLEIKLNDEIIKLNKQRLNNIRERIGEEVSLEKGKVIKIQALLEQLNVNGTEESLLKELRALKEKEIKLNIDSIKKKLLTYKEDAKERLALEIELIQEVTKLQTHQFNNRKEQIETELSLEKNKVTTTQALLELENVTGTEQANLEDLRVLKEKETQINIEGIKKQLSNYKLGAKERLTLEAEFVQEVTKLQKIKLDNKRQRIEEEVSLEKGKITKIQALLEQLNTTGTDELNLEVLRTLKEKEIQLNINGIKKQLATYKLSAKERLALEIQLIQEVTKLQASQFGNKKERLENQLAETKKELDDRQTELERATMKGTSSKDLEAERKLREDDIKYTIDSITKKANLHQKGSKERIELERQIGVEYLKLDKLVYTNQESRLVEQIDNRKRLFKETSQQLEKLLTLGTSPEDAKKIRDSKEKEIQLNIQDITEKIKLAKKGSKERRDLEIALNDEIIKLSKQRVSNRRESIEEEVSLEKTKISKIQSLLERSTINGTSDSDLEKVRKFKEQEILINIDSIKKQLATYKLSAKERLSLEAQLVQEITKLQKTQFDNEKSKLEDSLDKTQKALEKRQIALEKLAIAGTTNEDLEASRKLKEDEISNTINSLKQRSILYKVGKKERIALEQEIVKETLKLDKQIYENQKSRLEQQINDRRRAFKSSQLDLEKLLVLGTSVEDAKKVRAAKEDEIRLNIDSIKKQVAIAKVGSTQRKDLEISLKDEIIKLDKQKIANKRDLIEEEVSLERGKIAKIESLLERSNVGGTFEKNLDKIRVLKEKEVQINISSLQKEIAVYKGSAKEKAGLEITLTQLITKQQTLRFSNRKERLEAELALSKSNLEKQLALKESALIDGGTEEELKAMESMKVKEAQLNVDSIRKQIKLYKEGSKERLALEINLQKELNNLKRASLDKEKNLIQLALDFKKTKVDIANIESEKALLKGNITREEFEDKLTASSQKVNLLQQEAFIKQLKLYQKGSREYLAILKDLSQLQVDYQKSVVDKAIREIDRLVKKQNNSIEAQKQNIQKQLNVGDYLTKQLQEQIKLEESRNSIIKATSDYQVGLLEITKRTTGDVEKKAKIDLQIAEIKQKSLLESQKLEINSIKNNNAINQSALEREKIQLRLNKLELDRSKISAETELRKAKLNKLDKTSIDALELQLQNINTQYEELKRSENLINTQIRNQAEISANQLKIVKQQQDLAKRNGELDVEQVKQAVIIAGYEKQLSQLKMKGILLEANSNKEKVIGELLTKAYDTQLSLLNSRKELMDSTLSSIDTLYGIEQSMAKSDLTKEKLAQDQARDKLVFLELQQKMERDSFNLEKAKNKIVRERQKVELEIAQINAKQALAVAKVEQAKINARKDATDEEKLAVKLAVDAAEQGIIAAKANKELSIEISKIEEQSEKNKDIIFNRNQRNQKLQAEAGAAQTTTNTVDDSNVAAQARKFREQDEKNLKDTASISTGKIDKTISDFQKAMEAKKPISLNIVKKTEVPIKPSTIEATTSRKEEDKKTPKTKIETTPISNKTEKTEKPIEKKEPDNKTLSTSIADIGTSITNTIKSSSETLGKLIESSLKGLGNIIVASVSGNTVKPVTPTTEPIKPITAKPKPQPKLPPKVSWKIIKGIGGQEDSIEITGGPEIVAPPNPSTYAPGGNKSNNNKTNDKKVEPKTKEPLVDSLKTIRQSVDAFKLSFDKSNQTKKTEEDLRNKGRDKDNIHTDIKELIGVMQEYINKGGDITINSPINVNGGSKETGVDINTHLYNLATKLERRQK